MTVIVKPGPKPLVPKPQTLNKFKDQVNHPGGPAVDCCVDDGLGTGLHGPDLFVLLDKVTGEGVPAFLAFLVKYLGPGSGAPWLW